MARTCLRQVEYYTHQLSASPAKSLEDIRHQPNVPQPDSLCVPPEHMAVSNYFSKTVPVTLLQTQSSAECQHRLTSL